MDKMELIAEPHRREILRLLWSGEMSAGELASQFDITFGAVSQHLRRLREADLVTVRTEGNFRFYQANTDRLAPFAPVLEAMWSSFIADVARDAERAQ